MLINDTFIIFLFIITDIRRLGSITRTIDGDNTTAKWQPRSAVMAVMDPQLSKVDDRLPKSATTAGGRPMTLLRLIKWI